ncbi:hypothetical protein BJV74DRAFT_880816 [Russula compacta]|nr:hypothetical protein BJV74DRAFT_880816 [Russula compacta]
MKGMIEVFGFEWRMLLKAPGEAEAELAHLNSIGIINAILSDNVNNFLFGAKVVICNPGVNLTGNSKHATKNADGCMDGNHSTIHTSADLLADSSVQLPCSGLILIGLLSGDDYHPASLLHCGPGTAHRLAKCGLGDELLEAAQSLTHAKLPKFLTTYFRKPSLANAILYSFPNLNILLFMDDGEEEDCSLRDLIIKIHSSQTHTSTDDILEYWLEIAPAQLVCLTSAGI